MFICLTDAHNLPLSFLQTFCVCTYDFFWQATLPLEQSQTEQQQPSDYIPCTRILIAILFGHRDGCGNRLKQAIELSTSPLPFSNPLIHATRQNRTSSKSAFHFMHLPFTSLVY